MPEYLVTRKKSGENWKELYHMLNEIGLRILDGLRDAVSQGLHSFHFCIFMTRGPGTSKSSLAFSCVCLFAGLSLFLFLDSKNN